MLQNERYRCKDLENLLKTAEFENSMLKRRNEELISDKAELISKQSASESAHRQELQALLEVNRQHELNLQNTRAKINEMDKTVNKV